MCPKCSEDVHFDDDLTLAAGQGCILWYDSTSSRWRLLAKTSASGAKGVISQASGDITPDSDNDAGYDRTALAANCTINADTGTPANGRTLIFRFLDDGAARTLTWNAQFVNDAATLPITTEGDGATWTNVGVMYNSADSKYHCMAASP